MKLTLNAQALAALFDADQEFAVKFKTETINKAVEKHIKAIDKMAISYVEEELKHTLMKYNYNTGTWVSNENLKSQIRTALGECMNTNINAIIKEKVEEKAKELDTMVIDHLNSIVENCNDLLEAKTKVLQSNINQAIESTLTTEIEKYITEEVQRRLEAALSVRKALQCP
jgi:hypothetical protein